jgi:hypothetical protein
MYIDTITYASKTNVASLRGDSANPSRRHSPSPPPSSPPPERAARIKPCSHRWNDGDGVVLSRRGLEGSGRGDDNRAGSQEVLACRSEAGVA